MWRHIGRYGVSNHHPNDYLLKRLFRRRSKKTSKRCHWSLLGEFTGDRWIPRTKGQWRGKCFHLMTSSYCCNGNWDLRDSAYSDGRFIEIFNEHPLTHWVTHICVGNLISLGPDNGLSPGRRQAIIWTDAGILLIGLLGTNFSEISIDIHTFSFTKMHLKMSSAKWRPFCLGLNVLNLLPTNVVSNQAGGHSKFTDVIIQKYEFSSSVVVQRHNHLHRRVCPWEWKHEIARIFSFGILLRRNRWAWSTPNAFRQILKTYGVGQAHRFMRYISSS